MPSGLKLEFHDADTDTDILARILADTSDTRDFPKLFLWQAERRADILATIHARMSVSVSAPWNASLNGEIRWKTCTSLGHATPRCRIDARWRQVIVRQRQRAMMVTRSCEQ